MTPANGSVATIIRCSDLVRHVYATLASVERQTLNGGEIVLVIDESTPLVARDWLAALARERGLVLASAARSQPGAVKNTGIRATTAPYIVCVDAGDLLDPRHHEVGAAMLSKDRTIGIASSAVRIIGGPRQSEVNPAARFGAEGLAEGPGAAHGSSMFRRADWDSFHGFDETLPVLDYYEFWLRLAGAGHDCARSDRPLLVRTWRKDSLWYRDAAEDAYMAAITSICRAHIGLLRHHLVPALYARERQLAVLGERYRQLIVARDRGLAERGRLVQRAADLRGILPEDRGRTVEFADFRRTAPLDRNWGYSRGVPIDRHYIERFIESCSRDIHGSVLEVQEADYTQRFGGEKVADNDVVDLDPKNPKATVVTDLRAAANIPSERYDCVILTQTLHEIDDMEAVLVECRRILKPGGVLLATLPCASRLCLEYGPDDDFWRVTAAGARALVEPIFGAEGLEVRWFGNVFANAAFLYGLACHELTAAELEAEDPYFPLLVGIRARKPILEALDGERKEAASLQPRSRATPQIGDARGAVLLYHRVADSKGDVHGLAISPDLFRQQMACLAERCHAMRLEDLVSSARQGRLPTRAVAVTFDDGYMDNESIAAPILKAFAIPATFFITTDRIVQPPEFWWDLLARCLLDPDGHRPTELRVNLPQGPAIFPTRSESDCLAAHWSVYHAIVGSPASLRDEVVRSIHEWSGIPPGGASKAPRMDATAICALAAVQDFAIGAHTVHHERLPEQLEAVQRQEVVESRVELERLLGCRIATFAYPFGAWDVRTADLVREASFDVAVTSAQLPVTSGVNPWLVPRLTVTPARAEHFSDWLDTVFGDPA